jgi:hypothetical protein
MPANPRFEDLLRPVIDCPDAASVHALEQAMRSDPALRREYLDQIELDTLLAWELGKSDSPALETLPSIHLASSPRYRRVSFALAAAAAVTLLFGAGFFLGSHFGKSAPVLAAQGHATPHQPAAPVAVLIEGEDCEWLLPPQRPRPVFGSGFPEGETLRIDSGIARLAMRNRAGIAVEGPVELELLSSDVVRVLRGSVSAYAPDEAIGFKLLTPGVEIVDLGTRFAARVEADGSTEVHVFEGEVSVRGKSAAPLKTTAERVTGGQARRYDADGSLGGEIALAPESFAAPPDLEQLLAASPRAPDLPIQPVPTPPPAHDVPSADWLAFQDFRSDITTAEPLFHSGHGFATGWANPAFTRLIAPVTSHTGDTQAGGFLLVRGRDKAEPNIANRFHRELAAPLPDTFYFALRASYHGLDTEDFFALWIDSHGREDASHASSPAIGLREGRFFARLSLEHTANGPPVRDGETFVLIGRHGWDAENHRARVALWVNPLSSASAPLAETPGPRLAGGMPDLRFAGIRMGKDTEVSDRLLVHQIVLTRSLAAALEALAD